MMTYYDALHACNLDEDTLSEIYQYIDQLTEADELEYLSYPAYMEKLIEIMIKPDAVMVCTVYGDHSTPWLDRVYICKNNRRTSLRLGYHNEYIFMKRLTGT
jgi:predicted metallo-beta-lactamase superfamily hydrolase